MRALIRYCFYISLLLLPLQSGADVEIAGIRLPATYTIDTQQLALNGAGIRSKFFVKVYVGALYLGETARSADDAISAGGPKSMQMVILYTELEAAKITQGWEDGFRKNLGEDAFAGLSTRLQTFNALFPTLRQGDRVHMDFVPGEGTGLSVNGEHLGRIPGDDFFDALLRVWLGDAPADAQLKQGLLGN